jgi:hypothetical protein
VAGAELRASKAVDGQQKYGTRVCTDSMRNAR